MAEILSFITTQEMIIVCVIIAIAIALCIAIYIVEKNKSKRRMRHNTRELNKLVEQIKEEAKEEVAKEEVYYEEPIMQMIPDDVKEEPSSIMELMDNTIQQEVIQQPQQAVIVEMQQEEIVEEQEEKLQYTSMEPDQETAKLELHKLTEELKKEESIEDTQNISLTNFEEEQEENAIISLDELLKKSKEMYESNERTQYVDENTMPISLQELEQSVGLKAETSFEEPFIISNVVPKEEQVIPEEEKKQQPIFKSSPIISPIYGIEGHIDSNELSLENTANYEKLDKEIKKTNEFLMTLKELQQEIE